jgi:uncharacterized membrane protein (UPF0127 family)
MPTKDTAKTASAPSRLKQFSRYLVLLIITIVFGIGVYFAAINNPKYRSLVLGNEPFRLEIANNDGSRVKGLSGRSSLSQNAGMLFDFGNLGDWQIWMKDMRFSIDILWLNQNGKIVGVKTDVSPSTYPQNFGADSPGRYVIELPSGTVERLELQLGDTIKLE